VTGTSNASGVFKEALMRHRQMRPNWSVLLIPALLLASLAACDPRRATSDAAVIQISPAAPLITDEVTIHAPNL
jgi:hypothetical protein